MSHLFQLGETCVSAGRDMCLTFFSLVRHVSQLCDTVSHLFQLGETCVSPFSIPGSNTGTLQLYIVDYAVFILYMFKVFISCYVIGHFASIIVNIIIRAWLHTSN